MIEKEKGAADTQTYGMCCTLPRSSYASVDARALTANCSTPDRIAFSRPSFSWEMSLREGPYNVQTMSLRGFVDLLLDNKAGKWRSVPRPSSSRSSSNDSPFAQQHQTYWPTGRFSYLSQHISSSQCPHRPGYGVPSMRLSRPLGDRDSVLLGCVASKTPKLRAISRMTARSQRPS